MLMTSQYLLWEAKLAFSDCFVLRSVLAPPGHGDANRQVTDGLLPIIPMGTGVDLPLCAAQYIVR